MAAHTKLIRLRYDQKSNFVKFIRLFEMHLDDAILAGNAIPERDQMYQLTIALGPEFVSTLRSMKNEEPHN